MRQLVYVSTATRYFSEVELADLLARAREKNQRLGITGMLLYRDGDFMQAIEGEDGDLERLFASIRVDSRHDRVTPILEHAIERRSFADWTMGFRQVRDAEIRRHPGFSDFLAVGFADAGRKAPSLALRLLSTFAAL